MRSTTIDRGVIEFRGTRVRIIQNEYVNGGPALDFIDEADGEPYLTATAWVPGLLSREVAIKDYSENEGVYAALLNAGIIRPAHRTVMSGFVELPVCALNPVAS